MPLLNPQINIATPSKTQNFSISGPARMHGKNHVFFFFYFSFAFDTIRLALQSRKLKAMQVEALLVSWIMDDQTGRPQYMRLQCCKMDKVIIENWDSAGNCSLTFPFLLSTPLTLLHRSFLMTQQKFDVSQAVRRASVIVLWTTLSLGEISTRQQVVDLRSTTNEASKSKSVNSSTQAADQQQDLGRQPT